MLGDCLDQLKLLPDSSIDSVVTDPPYGLAFMGKKWDYDVPSVEIWKEVLRVLKPGGHLLSFGGTRTYHRMVVAIEDAGFEIRDQIQWIYGSGFPKSHNLDGDFKGWGTALKPANEPVCMARKPLSEKTVASNVLKHGTGAINIDECRIGTETIKTCAKKKMYGTRDSNNGKPYIVDNRDIPESFHKGRWPANVILDEEAGKILDEQSGHLKSGHLKPLSSKKQNQVFGEYTQANVNEFKSSEGGASRFFYCAKASKSERDAGLEGMPDLESSVGDRRPSGNMNERLHGIENRSSVIAKNNHPTVKPIKLMSYLIKLITPPGGIVLDPFMGSGTTGVAAKAEGFQFVGIEREEQYFEICKGRILQ